MVNEVKLQAALHGRPLPDDAFETASDEKQPERRKLTTEQEAKLAAHLKEAQERVEKRYGR